MQGCQREQLQRWERCREAAWRRGQEPKAANAVTVAETLGTAGTAECSAAAAGPAVAAPVSKQSVDAVDKQVEHV